METKTDLSRPSVEVKIPQVKLQLRDLAFLRSLAQPDAVHCRVSENVMDKLRFLDLIAKANVPPTDKRISEVKEEQKKLLSKMEQELTAERWDAASNLIYQLKSNTRSLKPEERDVLTAKGEALLRTGIVTVRARKVGCV